jgi:hypothetical protein
MKFDIGMVSDPDRFFAEAIQMSSSLDELADVLETIFKSGLAVGEDGRFNQIRARVADVRGLRILVYPNDHDPPHFHVVGSDFDAKFTISACDLISGNVDGRRRAIVEWFLHHGGREMALRRWNETRPSPAAS